MKNLIRFTDPDYNWRVYAESQEALDSGDFYISVTTCYDHIVAAKLQNYMKKNTAGAQKKRLDETADIGTRIHNLIEKDLKGEEVYPEDDTAAAFDKWTVVRAEHDITAMHTEQLVYSDQGFAGTADIIGSFDGEPCLMDIKTGWYSIKTGWQLAAYRQAAIEMGILDKGSGMVGINIKRDGSTGKPFKYQHFDSCFAAFQCSLYTFKMLYWNKLAKMKWKYLMTPMTIEVKNES